MSIAFNIKSRTFLPLQHMFYTCEPEIQAGSSIRGLKMYQSRFPQDLTLGWFGSTTAHCENLVGLGERVADVSMKVNVRYRQPWFWERHQQYEFVGIVNPADGKVYKWLPK